MPRTSVISAFINDNASGGGGSTGPDGTQQYVELTIQSSQVASTLTDFPVYVDLSDMPTAFFTNVQSDGGDIRITESDGTTRCAVDLVSIDTSGSAGELHFLASSISSSSDTTFRIYYDAGGGLSQPGVATTYGRNAVWSDYEAVWHMNDDPSGTAPQITDSTGNGFDGTSNGTMTAGDSITGAIGAAVTFDGTDDYIDIGPLAGMASITNGFTLQAWLQGEATGNNQSIIGADDTEAGLEERVLQFRIDGDGKVRLIRFDASESVVANFATSSTVANTPSWNHVVATFDSSNGSAIFIDGTSDATDATTTSNKDFGVKNSQLAARRGAGAGGAITEFFSNGLDEIRVRASALPADWIASEYTNQNTPDTFYDVTVPFPDAWNYYVEVTIQSSQVASDLTNFPVYVDLSDLPAGFWSNVQSDGGDIRVTENDGTTQCPVDLVSIDTGASTGELHFLASSLSSSSDTTFRIYYDAGGGLSQPGVATTYGRNAVWAGYELVWHMSEDPSGTAPQVTDVTGNGHNGTSAGSMTSGDLVTGKLGNGIQFDGSNDHIEASDDAALSLDDFTITLWYKIDSLSGVDFIASADNTLDAWYIVTSDATGNWGFSIRDGSTAYSITTSNGFTADDSSWHYAAARRDGTELWINQDASGSPSSTTVPTASIDPSVGPRVSGREAPGATDGGPIAATVDEFRIRKEALSADWMSSEYTNQATPTTFYTIGSQTTV